MKKDVSYKGFLQFVVDQPEERSINHNTWVLCAVGDYVGRNETDCYNFANDILMVRNEILFDALNERWDEIGTTYGSLQKFIKQL